MPTLSTTSTKHRSLTTHQIRLLQTLYKFRFATAHLIAKHQGAKHVRVISARLKILAEQNYIGQNYDASYKLQGKQASYYLKPLAVRYLRTQDFADPAVLTSIYHDKRATDTQIAHRLHVFELYLQLKEQYPSGLKFYSKSELNDRDYFPRQKPDAFIAITRDAGRIVDEYFLEYMEENATYLTIRTLIRRYIAYAESKTWYKERATDMPPILITCDTNSLKRRVEQINNKELDRTYVQLKVLTATNDSLKI